MEIDCWLVMGRFDRNWCLDFLGALLPYTFKEFFGAAGMSLTSMHLYETGLGIVLSHYDYRFRNGLNSNLLFMFSKLIYFHKLKVISWNFNMFNMFKISLYFRSLLRAVSCWSVPSYSVWLLNIILLYLNPSHFTGGCYKLRRTLQSLVFEYLECG